MNRRHKIILFITLVLTGTALLAGAKLKESLGMMMLGAALAWAAGSDVAASWYFKLKGVTSASYLWIRLPLAMIFAGFAVGVAIVFSNANPVIAVAVASVVGVMIAPFSSLPRQRSWLQIPVLLVALVAFLFSDLAILMLDKSWGQDAGKFGQLTATSFFALVVGIWWLSKGWRLILRGIMIDTTASPTLPDGTKKKGSAGQYISLLLGVIALTLWLGLLTWSASSNWAYPLREAAGPKKNDNLLMQFGFVVFLAWWPYAAWHKILIREPNSEPKYLRRHKRIAAVAGMTFVVVLSLAVTFGIQNGHDRATTAQITKSAEALEEVATKIGNLKRRDLKTTDDYIKTYYEIELLQSDLDAKIQEYAVTYRDTRRKDETRGPINIQRFYRSNTPEIWQANTDMIEIFRQVSELTKQESTIVRNMAALPEQDQPRYWQAHFRPLVEQENALRERVITVQTKLQPPKKKK